MRGNGGVQLAFKDAHIGRDKGIQRLVVHCRVPQTSSHSSGGGGGGGGGNIVAPIRKLPHLGYHGHMAKEGRICWRSLSLLSDVWYRAYNCVPIEIQTCPISYEGGEGWVSF